MSWDKYYGNKLARMLEPADLGHNARAVHTGLPANGNFFEIGAFDKFQLHASVVVTGGDRTAGTCKLTLEAYDAASGTLLSSFDLLTGIQRFGAGLTKRGSLGFGPGLAAAAQGDGSPAAGASTGLVRSVAVARLVVAADAAYSGGTADPTSALLSVWFFLSQ
jgi:hypothetical protein